MEKPKVRLYTDGSSRGNPGPGGYGLILEWVGKAYVKEFSEGFLMTTNNRMELMAVIEGLKKLKGPSMVTIITDSKYVVDAIEKKWVFGWEKKNFKDKKNADLWRMFLQLYPHHEIEMKWVKGHNNHPQNERCDKLAVLASKQPKLQIDRGFHLN